MNKDKLTESEIRQIEKTAASIIDQLVDDELVQTFNQSEYAMQVISATLRLLYSNPRLIEHWHSDHYARHTIEKVRYLINTWGASDAPPRTERYGEWYQTTVPIGKDHVAWLTLDDEAYNELFGTTDKKATT